MLISKSRKIDDGDIVSFKLVNGDELIGKVESQTDDTYVIHRPCLVVPSQQGIGLIQAMFSADPDQSIDIRKQHIMMYAATFDQLKSHYIQTTTGIATLSTGRM